MIVFGTDGWRGLIARDFTFDNVQRVSHATADYIESLKTDEKKTVVIGYDTRFLSRKFAEESAIVFASRGIAVLLTDGISTTPQVSLATLKKKATLGIVITASHNPPEYNGFKVKGSFGGPAKPEQIKEIEKFVKNYKPSKALPEVQSFAELVKSKLIKEFDANKLYQENILKKIDIEAITKSKFKIAYDAMHGAGLVTFQQILPSITMLHGEINPSFGEIDHPEPIESCLPTLQSTLKNGKYSIGLATDGDADRLGVFDTDGTFIDSHKLFMILLQYLYHDRGLRGAVAKTVSLTSMVNKFCEKYSIPVFETAVGFKYIAKLMVEEKILIGGEESGGLGTSLHIPERDGIFNGLLLLEIMAKKKKTLSQLCKDLENEFGTHYIARIDAKVSQNEKETILAACKALPKKIGKYTIDSCNTLDGFKFMIGNSWLLVRASGTEPLIRFYAESSSKELAEELVQLGRKLR